MRSDHKKKNHPKMLLVWIRQLNYRIWLGRKMGGGGRFLLLKIFVLVEEKPNPFSFNRICIRLRVSWKNRCTQLWLLDLMLPSSENLGQFLEILWSFENFLWGSHYIKGSLELISKSSMLTSRLLKLNWNQVSELLNKNLEKWVGSA